MGKTSRSETQNTYPEWLSQLLNPLIAGSTQKMGDFQNQGWNVLQGGNPGPPSSPLRGGGSKLPSVRRAKRGG